MENDNEFTRTLRELLRLTKLTQSQLGEESGISQAQVSGIVTGRRHPSRSQVNRLTLGLMLAATRQLPGDSTFSDSQYRVARMFAPRHLEAASTAMLALAGYAPEGDISRHTKGVIENSFWESLQPGYSSQLDTHGAPAQELRFGWFPYLPLAVPDEVDPSAAPPGGFSREVCDRVAHLLGVTPRYIRLKVEDAELALERGLVDVMAPLIRHPSRMRSMAFSQPIGGLRIGLEALVPKKLDYKKDDFPSKFFIKYPSGGTSYSLFRLEYPSISKSEQERQGVRELDHWKVMYKDGYYEPRTKLPICFIMDEITAIYAVHTRPEEFDFGIGPKVPEERKVLLRLALAVKRSEPALLHALNDALSLVTESDLLREVYSKMEESSDDANREIIKRVWRERKSPIIVSQR